MKIYKISQESPVEQLLWKAIESDYPDIENILHPNDIDSFKGKIKDLIQEIEKRINYAKTQPRQYDLEFKNWEDDDWQFLGDPGKGVLEE